MTSPASGVIVEFLVADGDTVEKGQELLRINVSGAQFMACLYPVNINYVEKLNLLGGCLMQPVYSRPRFNIKLIFGIRYYRILSHPLHLANQ